jgi:hypothetical protein
MMNEYEELNKELYEHSARTLRDWARMPARSGQLMAALVPLKGLGCLEVVEGDFLRPVHN